jgi:mRNA interferase YafQ
MKKLKTTNSFEKELFKMLRRGVKICNPEDYIVISNILSEGAQIPQKYCDHKLHGEFRDFRGLHINPDWVLVYRTDADFVYMHRTGTHSDIYS